MTVRIRLPFIAAVLGTVLVAGCTSTLAGTPVAGPGATSDAPQSTDPTDDPPPEDDLPSDGAPKVEEPLVVAQYEQNPCAMLSADQTQALNVPATGEPTEVAFGKGCIWRNAESGGRVEVQFFSTIRRGLSAVYREAKANSFPYFERIDDIEGYPAVAFDLGSDKPTARCAISVGVSDQLVFTARGYLSDENIGRADPCQKTAEAVGMMMKTMRGER